MGYALVNLKRCPFAEKFATSFGEMKPSPAGYRATVLTAWLTLAAVVLLFCTA